jgi:hypothetical protein
MIDARYPGPSALVQVIGRIAAIQGVHEVVPADSLD